MTDLDALEKLAARIWSALNDRCHPRFSDMESAAEALDALISELREARELLARLAETPAGKYDAAVEAIRIAAFLSKAQGGE